MRKITRRHSRSPKYAELDNFMLLFCRGPTGKKCTKIYNARAQPLFCSLNFLFGGFLVAVGVMVSTWPFQCTRPVPSRPVLQTKVRQKQSANKPWWQQMVYRNHRPWERQRIQGYNWNNKKSENTIFWIQVLSQGYVCTVLKTKNSSFMLPLQRNRQVLSGIFFLGVFSLFCT